MKRFHALLLFTIIASFGATAPASRAQIAPSATYSASASDDDSASQNTASPARDTGSRSTDTALPAPGKTQPEPGLVYRRPTDKEKLHGYLFDAFGPYPIAGAALVGAINQASKTPPEWGQGMGPYGERVGSAFGIALVTTTTRYALAKAFHEDTLYYRCECEAFVHRFDHALISTVTARVGDSGRRHFSFPALVSPYAGSMTAVYGWYPSRYGPKDGFRMGNYALLAFVAVNIVHEFIYGGPHTLIGHIGHSSSTDSGN